MELDHLKSDWKNVNVGNKSQNELSLMTKVKNHPKLKQIRLKLIVEATLLMAFLVLYYDGFDGADKPLWINALLISTALIYILNRCVSLLVIRKPIKEINLMESLKSFRNSLERVTLFTLITSFLFGGALILFFSTTIEFDNTKYLMLAGMIVTLLLFVLISGRVWINRVRAIKKTLEEFS